MLSLLSILLNNAVKSLIALQKKGSILSFPVSVMSGLEDELHEERVSGIREGVKKACLVKLQGNFIR